MTFILFVSSGNLIFYGFSATFLLFFFFFLGGGGGSINVYLKLLFVSESSNNFSCGEILSLHTLFYRSAVWPMKTVNSFHFF